jgi:hypothetical protein
MIMAMLQHDADAAGVLREVEGVVFLGSKRIITRHMSILPGTESRDIGRDREPAARLGPPPTNS